MTALKSLATTALLTTTTLNIPHRTNAGFFSRFTEETVTVSDDPESSRVVGGPNNAQTTYDYEQSINYGEYDVSYEIEPGHLGYCPDNDYTLPVPNLELAVGSASRPVIDGKLSITGDGFGDNPVKEGWTGAEYAGFVEIPMFNGGKNGQPSGGTTPYTQGGRIGTAYIAYDCGNEIVCAAAHLHYYYIISNGQATDGSQIDNFMGSLGMNDNENWIRFGQPDGSPKLFPSDATEFQFIVNPRDGHTNIIGWEGCWNIEAIDEGSSKVIWPRVNNHVEIHFNRNGQTTSTGKLASNGIEICLESSIQPCTPNTCQHCMGFEAMTPESLIHKFMSSNNDVVYENVQASPHWDQCMRYFFNGDCLGNIVDYTTGLQGEEGIVPNEGIILSSGNPLHFNCQDSDAQSTKFYSGSNYLSDADLRKHVCTSMGKPPQCAIGVYDACWLSFDFKCDGSGYVPEVNFKYVFGSEEYYEYVASQFNDAFAFLLNGENIALLETSHTGTRIVSINNVNYSNNTNYFHGNDPPTYADEGPIDSGPSDGVEYDTKIWYPSVEADGFTVKLTARGTPLADPNAYNTIKLVIGDVGDGILDSWVLLQGGTFTCVPVTDSPTAFPTGTPTERQTPVPTDVPTSEPTGGGTTLVTVKETIQDPNPSPPTYMPTNSPVSPTVHPTLACA